MIRTEWEVVLIDRLPSETKFNAGGGLNIRRLLWRESEGEES